MSKRTPNTDAFGNTEIIFSPSNANDWIEISRRLSAASAKSSADQEIQRLKTQGLWRPTFDVYQFPVLFAEFEKSETNVDIEIDGIAQKVPLVRAFASLVERVYPAVVFAEIARGPDFDLHQAAKRLQRVEGIPYSDALDLANQDRLWAARTASFGEQSAQSRGVVNRELSDTAERRAREKNISYGDALSEIVEERPELLNR